VKDEVHVKNLHFLQKLKGNIKRVIAYISRQAVLCV